MNLPRAGRKALYVKVNVIDFDTGLPVVLTWQLSIDDGVTWVSGTPATIIPPGGVSESVTRFLLRGPDAPNDTPSTVVPASVDAPQVKSTDGDEILIATLGPITLTAP